MTPTEIKSVLSRPIESSLEAFAVLRSIARMLSREPENAEAQSLLIRSLEQREAFEGASELLNALLRETGLYPYAEPARLTSRDRLAFEFHRPEGSMGEKGTVFHRVQAQVYRALMDGANVILSAPTSFGKSLIIDAIIDSARHKRIVLVVPTIALIDETRKRLARFNDRYKIITHASQMPEQGERGAIYVLTQERVIDRSDLDEIDFFIIDEFYKLDPAGGGGDRAAILNHALYKLIRTAKQFYLLGPNIKTVPLAFRANYDVRVFVTDYTTVATNIERVDQRGGKQVALISLIDRLKDPTLVYCRSPGSVRRVVKLLIEASILPQDPQHAELVDWIGANFHPQWIVARALAHGIGIHHARLPRALAQHQVRLFNERKLRVLICTSTLIEGVNTAAKHVVVYDHQISTTPFDYFTFKNIQGRSGRMFQHFVGTVHLFHEPPAPELLDVDIPVFTQSDAASDGLLVQLDEVDLGSAGSQRVARLRDQDVLSFETIKGNSHVDPERQIELAKHIARNARELQPILVWERQEPNWEELSGVCDLLFETLLVGIERNVVRSGRQLAFLIHLLRQTGGPSAFVRERALKERRKTPDDGVEDALEFLRNWASFHVPRSLSALQRIQAEVYGRLGMRAGDYSVFAVRLESLLLTPSLAALDEYGLPLAIVERLAHQLRRDENLDEVLEDLKRLDEGKLGLSPFEQSLLAAVKDSL